MRQLEKRLSARSPWILLASHAGDPAFGAHRASVCTCHSTTALFQETGLAFMRKRNVIELGIGEFPFVARSDESVSERRARRSIARNRSRRAST